LKDILTIFYSISSKKFGVKVLTNCKIVQDHVRLENELRTREKIIKKEFDLGLSKKILNVKRLKIKKTSHIWV